MSTPAPTGHGITLPQNKTYTVVITGDNYPVGHEALLTFNQDPISLEWIASYSVPSVELSETPCQVTQPGLQIQFLFELNKPTQDQIDAGYIAGEYLFRFDPPGVNPPFFTGTVVDPHPGGAEDTFTASGNDF